jgi:hypothetical protein
MVKHISSSAGRISIMVVIVVSFVASLVTLKMVFGGGAIGSENESSAIFKILGFYVPLFTLIATFYFKEKWDGISGDTPLETFFVAIVIVLIWAAVPVVLFMSVYYIEDVLSYIDKLVPLGESLALMALGYYFTKRPA